VECWGHCWVGRRGEAASLLRARGAGSVDEEVVAGIFEAAGKPGPGLHLAAFELMDVATDIALEVMVMGFAGDLVAGGVAGNLNRGEPLVFEQAADVAIDSGDADCIHVFLREGEGFVRREGAIGLKESGSDGIFLTGLAGLDGSSHEQTYSSVLRSSSQLPLTCNG
jgi:hypothetical protein